MISRVFLILSLFLLVIGCTEVQLDDEGNVIGTTDLAIGPPNGLPSQENPNAAANANFGCPLPNSCNALDNRWQQELDEQLGCDTVADCTTVLTGTSCGCTRALVGRDDTDIGCLTDIADELWAQGCVQYHPFMTTCDCPPADGFACVDNRCTWNYIPRPLPL